MKARPFLPVFIVGNSSALESGVDARMHSRPGVWGALFITLLTASTGYSVPINIISTHYAVAVSIAAGGGYSEVTDAQSSPSPISDSLNSMFVSDFLGYPAGYTFTMASADAGLFGVSGMTTWNPTSSQMASSAYAESDLWFSPVSSQTATINIQSIAGQNPQWTSGNMRLFDVTSGNELWNYGWAGNANWNYYGAPSGIDSGTSIQDAIFSSNGQTLQLDTALNSLDIYQLILRTGSTAGSDSESESIQLTGLEPVPEPSFPALLGLGSVVLAMIRRARKP